MCRLAVRVLPECSWPDAGGWDLMQCIYQIVIIVITIITIMCITALPESFHRQRIGVRNAIAEGPRHSEIK